MSLLSKIEGFGETILEDLLPIIAGLSAANNPDLAPEINAASSAAVTEIQNIASGASPTASTPALAQLAQAVVEGAAQKALNNSGNTQTQAIIGKVAPIVAAAVGQAINPPSASP